MKKIKGISEAGIKRIAKLYKTSQEDNFFDNWDSVSLEQLEELYNQGNLVDLMLDAPDSSWYDDEQGDTDFGPYGGWYYQLWLDDNKGFYAILGISDFSHQVELYSSRQEALSSWESIKKDAMQTAYENKDWDYFGMDEEELKAEVGL